MDRTIPDIWQQRPRRIGAKGGIFIGLGGNIATEGSSVACYMVKAIKDCADAGLVPCAISSLYCSRAMGGPAQPDYLNAVIEVGSMRSPDAVLACLHVIEAAAGRERDIRFGPRTLDLDLLDAEGAILPEIWSWRREASRDSAPDQLVVPHPRLHLRRFVLEPLLEIAPEWYHPALGASGVALLAALPDQGVVRIPDQGLAIGNLAP